MSELDDVLVVLDDPGVPYEDRFLHGLQHLIRETHRHHQTVEEMLMTIQDDVNALGERMGTAVATIEQRLDVASTPVDLTPINAVADKLDALAGTTTAQPTTSAQFQPLYLVDGDANADPSQWTQLAGFTTDTGRPVFTYAGDAGDVGSPATGDNFGGVWHVYVGDLTPTS